MKTILKKKINFNMTEYAIVEKEKDIIVSLAPNPTIGKDIMKVFYTTHPELKFYIARLVD